MQLFFYATILFSCATFAMEISDQSVQTLTLKKLDKWDFDKLITAYECGRNQDAFLGLADVYKDNDYDFSSCHEFDGTSLLFYVFDEATINYLVANGCGIDNPNKHGITPFGYALKRERNFAEVFLKCGASGIIDVSKGTGIWHYITSDSLTDSARGAGTYMHWLHFFPEQMKNTQRDNNGRTIFHYAAKNESARYADFDSMKKSYAILSLYHKNINSADKNGITPLIILQEKGLDGYEITQDGEKRAKHPLYELLESSQNRADVLMQTLPNCWPKYIQRVVSGCNKTKSGEKRSMFDLVNSRQRTGEPLNFQHMN